MDNELANRIEQRAHRILAAVNDLADIASSQMLARVLAHAEEQTALLQEIRDAIRGRGDDGK